MDWSVFWSAVSAIASSISSIIVAVSVLLMLRQLREMREATNAQTYIAASERLQIESVRSDRQRLFRLAEKPLDEWSEEDIAAAGRVCHSYDSVGQMVRARMLPKDLIIDSWGHSVSTLWGIAAPLVKQYRTDREAPEIWDDFEWLAGEAKEFRSRRAVEPARRPRKAPQVDE